MSRLARSVTVAIVAWLSVGDLCEAQTTAPAANPGQRSIDPNISRPELPAGIAALPPMKISPFMDINRVTATQWAGAVSAAMEGTRLVYGPMTPEQTKVFEGKWVHMFDFPFKEGIDWLNQLNPLLGQFLAIRATMASTAIGFDGAWKEATSAARLHQERDAREALSIAYAHYQSLWALKKQLDQVVKDILALGDPPNPLYHRRKKRKETNDAFKQTRTLIRRLGAAQGKTEDPATDPVTGRWVQTRVATTQKVEGSPNLKPKVGGDNMSMSIEISGTIPVLYESGRKDCAISGQWKLRWDRPPLVHDPRRPWPALKASIESAGTKMPEQYTYLDDRGKRHNRVGPLHCYLYGAGKNEVLSTGGIPGVPHVPKEIMWEGWKDKDEGRFAVCPSNLRSEPSGKEARVTTYTLRAYATVGGTELWVQKVFEYEWDPTGAKDRAAQAEDEGQEGDEIALSLATAKTPEEIAQVTQEIEMRQEFIEVMRKNVQWSRDQLATMTDPNRRSEMVVRIIGQEADIQAEQDRINALKSGRFAHTRTAFDEMQSAAFIRKCQEEVNEMAARDRLRVGMLRMAGRAEPWQAERLRAFVLNNAKPGADSTELKKIAHMVYNQVQGDLEAKAARSEDEAIDADWNLAYVQSVKGVCDKAMMVGALMGGHSVMVAYEGAIGFIEGPPPAPGSEDSPTDPTLGGRIFEGAKRAAAWYNTATFVASEAFAGYEKGGYLGGDTNKGTLWGAAERAGEAFLMAKAIEYGVGKMLGQPPGELPRRLTVKEHFELAKYRQECEYAKALAEDYKRTFAEYRRIQQFNASAGEMAAMEKQLQQKAASLHASFEGKLCLKDMYAGGKDAAMLEDYVFRMGKNHEAVREAWYRKMEVKGYDDVRHWDLMEFRNSASAGSPGMDHDMGIRDIGEKFYKDRLRVSRHAMNEDAQKAWEKAYQETTGYSARQSFENITTSIHVEAYRDLAWIGDASIKQAKVNEILSAWAGQAADVTAVKNYEMFKSLTRVQAIVESSRGMAKDIETKLLPVLEQAASKFPESAARIRGVAGQGVGYVGYWQQVRDILKTAADNPIEADRQIRMLTGKSIREITNDLRDMMAFYGKAIGK